MSLRIVPKRKNRMKTLLLFLAFTSTFSFAQTNVIAAKSHASPDFINQNDPDNFGEYIPPRKIESVRYINNDCIVETYAPFWVEGEKELDTICEHPFLTPGQMDIKRLKAMYPEETEFIGFDELENDQKLKERELKKDERKQKKSSLGILLFFLGGGLIMSYLFLPNLRSARS